MARRGQSLPVLKIAAAQQPEFSAVQNTDQLATLYRTFGPLIYSRCRRALREESSVAETTAEVFARVVDVLASAEPRVAVELIARTCERVCAEVQARSSS